MLERQPPAPFVVHHHGTHRVAGKLPANCCGGNITFRKIRQQVNVNEEPVRDHNQCFDVTVQDHFQITLEPVPLIVRVRKNRYVRGLVQRVFNPAQNGRTKWIGDVEEHHAHAVRSFAAQETGHRVRPVTQLPRGLFNFFLGGRRDISGERCIVQNNGNRGRREAAQVRDIPHGYRIGLAGRAFHDSIRGSIIRHILIRLQWRAFHVRLLRRHFKRQRLTESPCFPRSEENPRHHPDPANDLRRPA